MKIFASVLVLAALSAPALADDSSRDVLPSIYEMQRIPGEARQAVSPAARSRAFPERGYGSASNAAMIRDVPTASGRYSAPTEGQTPRELNSRLAQ